MKNTKKLMIIIGFVFIFAGVALRVFPVRIPQQVTHDEIHGGSMGGSLGYWGKGETVPVNITVSGGDAQVNVYIKDPTRTVIYQDTITNNLNYEFTAETGGSYGLNLEITESESAKTLTIMQQRMWSRGPDITLIIAGIIIAVMAWTDFLKIIFPE
jgi:hypothetical protein